MCMETNTVDALAVAVRRAWDAHADAIAKCAGERAITEAFLAVQLAELALEQDAMRACAQPIARKRYAERIAEYGWAIDDTRADLSRMV